MQPNWIIDGCITTPLQAYRCDRYHYLRGCTPDRSARRHTCGLWYFRRDGRRLWCRSGKARTVYRQIGNSRQFEYYDCDGNATSEDVDLFARDSQSMVYRSSDQYRSIKYALVSRDVLYGRTSRSRSYRTKCIPAH